MTFVHRLLTLGPPVLVNGAGRSVPLGGKPLALLVWLTRRGHESAHRDQIADLLWSDADEARARQSLRQALTQIRSRLGPDALVVDGRFIELREPIGSDVVDFETSVADRRFEDAMALYGGHFLDRFALPGALQFEQWAELERRRLLAMLTGVLDSRVQALLDAGAPRDARTVALRLRDAEPERERSWRLLIESALALGDVPLAAADAAALGIVLGESTREPEPSTAKLLQRVRRGTGALAVLQPEQVQAIEGELIGREPQFALLIESWQRMRIQRKSLQLVIEAPAGLGKSRLLRDFARRLAAAGSAIVLERARPGEQDIPFAYAARLTNSLAMLPGAMGVAPQAAASLVALNPAVRAVYGNATTESVAADDLLRSRAWALGELLRCLADERPLALLIDDLQWLDDRSRTVLEGALAHAEMHSLLSVVARRGAGGAGPKGLAVPEAVIRLPPWNETETRAFIESVAAWPESPPIGEIASRMRTVTDGAPLLVLQVLELARARHLLECAPGEWRVGDEVAIGQWLSTLDLRAERIKALRPEERRVALVLAVAGGPVRVSAVAHSLQREEMESSLRTLEQAGWVVLDDDVVSLSHDALQEALLESSDDVEIAGSRLALGRAEVALRPQDRTGFQRAARLLIASGDEREILPLFAAWRTERGLGAEATSTTEAARQLLGELATPIRVAHLRRASSWRTRIAESRMPMLGIASAVSVVFGIVTWFTVQAVLDARPAAVRFVVAPLAATASVAMPIPVLEVVNRRGRRVARSGDTLRIIVQGPANPWIGATAVTRAGLAEFPEFRRNREDTTAADQILIRGTATGLVADTARLLSGSSLRIQRGMVNGQPLRPDVYAATVALGDSVRLKVELKASTSWAAASVNLVAVPTWGVPRSSWVSLLPIPTPARDFIQHAEVKLPPPPVAGRYYVFLILAAEPDGVWIASRTNWAVGRPRWGDGNDVANWGSVEAASVRRDPRATTPRMSFLYRGRTVLNPPVADVITIDVRGEPTRASASDGSRAPVTARATTPRTRR